MGKCKEARVKITNNQLSKLKSTTKYKAGTTLQTTQKNSHPKELLMNYF